MDIVDCIAAPARTCYKRKQGQQKIHVTAAKASNLPDIVRPARIKACARSKGFAFCDECAELRTCEKMHAFMIDPQWPYHQSVLKNMEMIRREGLAKWLEAQDQALALCQLRRVSLLVG